MALLVFSPGCGSSGSKSSITANGTETTRGTSDESETGGSLPSLFDYSQDEIAAESAILQTNEVTVGGQTYDVNELEDGDPFIGTYQLENGDIVITNQPLATFANGVITTTEPQTQAWQSPDGTNS